jgi:hypothetical protein
MKKALAFLILLGGCSPAPTAPAGPDPEIARIDRQLGELYRPLLALVEESRRSAEDFLKVLGRDYVFPTDRPLTDAELKLWLDKAENDLMPRNEKMCALVRAKRDLIDPPEPPSFEALLVHQDGWRALHEKWKKDGTAYAWHSPTAFPRALERDLKFGIKSLEARRAERASKA